jgi:hypothetical protein
MVNLMLAKTHHYRLVLNCHLAPSWSTTLPVVDFVTSLDALQRPITSMTLFVRDQAELIGLLVNLHAQGLVLVSLNCIEPRKCTVDPGIWTVETAEIKS